jgi:hypothetical protein
MSFFVARHTKPAIAALLALIAAFAYSKPLQAQNTPATTPAAAGTTVPVRPDDQQRCESYLPVLRGAKPGSAMLADPGLKKVAALSPDLVKCGAVAADSDELCKLLWVPDVDECRRLRFTFHELRANPNSREFLVSEEDIKNCRKDLPKYKLPASLCDDFRAALRAGDPSKCPKFDTQGRADVQGSEGWCQAIVALDTSKCTSIGGIDDREQGKEACERIINRGKSFAKGINELAKSGTPLERALAKAALKQPDACKPFEATALKLCLDEASAAIPDPKGAPATPAPQAAPPKGS